MRLSATILVATFVVATLAAGRTASAEEKGMAVCPGYRTALAVARGALVRGERDAAVAALARAKLALEHCRHEEARKGSLLAAMHGERPIVPGV
jgi:hypothetical protein